MRSRLLRAATLAGALTLLASCGAVAGRLSYFDSRKMSLSERTLFLGTLVDWHVLTGGEMGIASDPPPLWRIAALIDLAPSMALDVVLIPADLVAWWVYRDELADPTETAGTASDQ